MPRLPPSLIVPVGRQSDRTRQDLLERRDEVVTGDARDERANVEIHILRVYVELTEANDRLAFEHSEYVAELVWRKRRSPTSGDYALIGRIRLVERRADSSVGVDFAKLERLFPESSHDK